jgi:hypothetical protein
MWVQALAAPSTWDDGVDGALLCHLLFSVHDEPTAHGAAMLRFRCGPMHGQHGTKTNYKLVPQAQHAAHSTAACATSHSTP